MPAFAAAAAALGRELTLPEVAQSVVLTRTPGRASAMPPRETLAAFAATGATLAIHLSIHALDRSVAELTPFYGADCPVAIVYRASWPDERILRGTLATIGAAAQATPIERSALILVGPALAAQDFAQSALYSADYIRRFRGGARAMSAPGLLIAAPRSGSGKTMLTLGLLRAFRRAGLVVAGREIGARLHRSGVSRRRVRARRAQSRQLGDAARARSPRSPRAPRAAAISCSARPRWACSTACRRRPAARAPRPTSPRRSACR